MKNNVVQYNSVITNAGGAYDATECVFTAPSDGYYVFTWSTSQYDGKYTDTAIVKNGAEFLSETAYANAGSDTAATSSQTVTIHIGVGDRIWIKTLSRGTAHPHVEYNNRFEGVFTGLKI